jgi:hypothetical protein
LSGEIKTFICVIFLKEATLVVDIPRLTPDLILAGVVLAVAAVIGLVMFASSVCSFGRLLYTLLRTLVRRKRSATKTVAEPEIDLAALATTGPPATGPTLHAYNVPMRVVVLVLAPVGRGNTLPATDQLPRIVDQIVPGLFAVAQAHQARIKLWPPQLSAQGFAAALFANLPLPGHRGKGTPWCAISGRFAAGDQSYLAGLVLRADAPNSLGQMTLAHEAQWLEVLRTSVV